MKCQRCKNDFAEKEIQEHHIHPRFMDNTSGEGIKIQLCEKCHNILHNIIPAIIYKMTPDKNLCIKKIIKFTEHWIKETEKEDDNKRRSPI